MNSGGPKAPITPPGRVRRGASFRGDVQIHAATFGGAAHSGSSASRNENAYTVGHSVRRAPTRERAGRNDDRKRTSPLRYFFAADALFAGAFLAAAGFFAAVVFFAAGFLAAVVFFAAGFFAAVAFFAAAGFLAAGALRTAGFLAAVFRAAAVLAAGFFAAVREAAGFLAGAFFAAGFRVAVFAKVVLL